ncbi:MAG: hypothetical protein K6A67_04610 [Bacteroidales bacterium]|nr:hypothetical protein [Bacteroidales bacterium]
MAKNIFLPAMAILIALTLTSCEKSKIVKHFDYDGPCHCGVDNPLEDFEWLNNNVVQFEKLRDKMWASISICTYDSTKQGFLINRCVQCDDGTTDFYDCNGNALGSIGGLAGIPLSTYNIDTASVHEIYRNYPDTAATLVGKSWQIAYFVDRETWNETIPMQGNNAIPFWLRFNADGTIEGGGINQLYGNYIIYDRDRIICNIKRLTEIYPEIYDLTGWEQRLIDALNDATIYDIDYYGRNIKIYYDFNRKFIVFNRKE